MQRLSAADVSRAPATDTALTFQYVLGFRVIISFAEIAIKAGFRGTPRYCKDSGLRSMSDSSITYTCTLRTV